jgi:O-antigen ligase
MMIQEMESSPARPERLATPERAALAMLGLCSVVVLPGALNRFVFGKLAVAALGVALAAVAPARGRLPRAATALLAVAAGLLLTAALTEPVPRAALAGLPPRYEGGIGLPIYLGALVAGARLLGVGRARGASACFLRWLSVAAIAVGLVALLDELGVRLLTSSTARAGGLLGNASDEGAWAALALGPLAAVALAGRRPLHVGGAVAAGIALVCSGSRGALVGALAMGCVLVLSAPGRRAALLALVALAAIPVAALATPQLRGRVLGRTPYAARTVTGRILLWQETGRLLSARPLLGAGPSAYASAIAVHHTPRYERAVGPADPVDSPHDWLLQAAVSGGVALALLSAALAAMTIVRGRRAARVQPTRGEAAFVAGLLAGLTGYATALLFHFTSPGTTPLAAVFAGALLVGAPSDVRPRAPRLRRGLRVAAVTAVAALVALTTTAALAELPLRTAILAAAAGRPAAADTAFHRAARRRPWDTGIATIAAHAFAVLAARGVPGAAAAGRPWAAEDVAAHPGSPRTLADAALLAAAAGAPLRARALLRRAWRLDPRDPDLRDLTQALVRWPASR